MKEYTENPDTGERSFDWVAAGENDKEREEGLIMEAAENTDAYMQELRERIKTEMLPPRTLKDLVGMHQMEDYRNNPEKFAHNFLPYPDNMFVPLMFHPHNSVLEHIRMHPFQRDIVEDWKNQPFHPWNNINIPPFEVITVSPECRNFSLPNYPTGFQLYEAGVDGEAETVPVERTGRRFGIEEVLHLSRKLNEIMLKNQNTISSQLVTWDEIERGMETIEPLYEN